jgi:transposase InsO family protein
MQWRRIFWHMGYYGIPRSRVSAHFLIARSPFYRWLYAAEGGNLGERGSKADSQRNTPAELAGMIWAIFEANPHFGRHRIANVLWLLGCSWRLRPCATCWRSRPGPVRSSPSTPTTCGVWIRRWCCAGACGHRPPSRRIVACCALDGPKASWVVDALEEAFERHGSPKHIITDQGDVFASAAFAERLSRRGVKQRFGAVGKHGSIAVTERAIRTLKQEWLRRVPVVRGLDHLGQLRRDFEVYYNECRGHSRLGGAVPACIHRGEQWTKPLRSAKAVPAAIERCVFADARVTAYRLTA